MRGRQYRDTPGDETNGEGVASIIGVHSFSWGCCHQFDAVLRRKRLRNAVKISNGRSQTPTKS
jgi:hypothetical protein